MKGADAVILSGGGANAAVEGTHKKSAARRLCIFGRLAACALLAATLVAGLMPAPAIEQAVAAAVAANGTLTVTHTPVGGTFALNNPVRLYVSAFSTANNLLSYQWYRNTANSTDGGTAVGENSSILVDGTNPAVGTYYYYAVVTDTQTGETAKSATAAVKIVDKGSVGNSLQNGDFQDVAGIEYLYNDKKPPKNGWWVAVRNVPGWQTTEGISPAQYDSTKDHAIEFQVAGTYPSDGIRNTSATGVLDPTSNKHAELCCNYLGSLFQEVATVPGSVYSWDLDHLSSNIPSKPDMMAVVVGPAFESGWSDGSDRVNYPYGKSESSDDSFFRMLVNKVVFEQGVALADLAGEYKTTYKKSGEPDRDYYISIIKGSARYTWVDHSGVYTVPEGQGMTVFGFAGLQSFGPNTGNILDNIVFAQGEPIAASSDVDSQGNGILSATAQNGYAYGILEVRGSTTTQVSNFQAKKGDTVLAEDATVAAAGGQGWYVPGGGTIDFTNLTPGKTYRIVQVPVGAIGGVMGQNKTPASVLDENCYDDFAVKPVSGGGTSSIGNIQVTARNESDGTCSLIVDPARSDVEYGVLAMNGDAALTDAPVKEWASSNTGKLTITGLEPNTSYLVVGRPKGYNEITYGIASASGTVIKTPSAKFKDVSSADVTRADSGESITVVNSSEQEQEYMIYDVSTKIALADGWYKRAKGQTLTLPATATATYQVVTRSAGAVPAPGVRVYPAPTENLAIDYVNESMPKGASMPQSLQYRAQDTNDPSTWYFGGADDTESPWFTGSGGSRVSLTAALEAMSASEDAEGASESGGADFSYRRTPDWTPAVGVDKAVHVDARPEPPAMGTASAHQDAGFWIDYTGDGALCAGAKDIQVRVAGTSNWTLVRANQSYGLALLGWTEVAPLGLEVRTAAVQDASFASEILILTVPVRAEAPETPKGKKNPDKTCLIADVNDTMEYREWGAADWIAVPAGATQVTGISDGTYEVRTKATDSAPASFSVTVSTTDAALAINATATRFKPQPWGYAPADAASALTIKNAGSANAAIKSIQFTGADGASFSLFAGEASGSVAAGQTDSSRKIAPVANLKPNTYRASAVVTYAEANEAGEPTGTEYQAAVELVLVVNKATQEKPASIATSAATDASLTVSATLPEGYTLAEPMIEFSIDGGITWIDGTRAGDGPFACAFPGLSAATPYEIRARMKADANRIVSDEASATFYTAYTAPDTTAMSINYAAETVSFGGSYEATSASSGGGDALSTGGAVSAYLGDATTFSIRRAMLVNMDGTTVPASAWTNVAIPARPAAPAEGSVHVTDAESSKANNGSITIDGANSLQYRRVGDSSWIPVNSNTLSGLGAGDYEVRLGATASAFASKSVTVSVDATKERFVTFMKNDGSTGDAAVVATKSATVESGWKVSAPSPAPERDHYHLAGWFAATGVAEDGSPVLAATPFAFESTEITADITLYAKWTADSYTLSFDTAGGGAAPGSQTVDYDKKAIAPKEPTKAGWAFLGWAFAGRAEGNTTVFDFTKTLAANFTDQGVTPPQRDGEAKLVAQWQALTYQVSFDAATGTVADNPAAPGAIALDQHVTDNKQAPSQPKRAGYDFDGWHLVDADGNAVGADYQFSKTLAENLTSASLTPGAANAPVVIKARWTELTYTVSFSTFEGDAAAPPSQDVLYTALVNSTAAQAAKRPGYALAGWHIEGRAQGNAKTYDFSKSLEWNLANQGVVVPASPEALKVALAAEWTANTYHLCFDTDLSGSIDPSKETQDTISWTGTTAAVPADAQKDGYQFAGWRIGSPSGPEYDNSISLEKNFANNELAVPDNGANIEMYAAFTANLYTLFFDADANGEFDTQKRDTRIENNSYSQAIANAGSVAVPQKTGYDFAAWHLVDAEGIPLSAEFALDTTLLANFEAAGAVPPKTSGAVVRLVPSFKARAYVLAADLNGDGEIGAGEPSGEGALFDEVVSKYLSQPPDGARAGYTFGGWTIKGATGNARFSFESTLEANCTAASFDPGVAGSTVVIERIWTPKSYDIAFDAAGGTPTPAGPVDPVLFNGAVAAPSQDPARPGYAFADWHLRTGGNDEAPVLSDAVYDFALTLEANFRAAGFDMDDATTPAPDVPAGGSTITLYAAWDPNSYELLFDADGDGTRDEGEATATVSSDATAVAPSGPMRPGYTFANVWHLAGRAEGNTASFDFSLPLIKNLEAAGYDTAATGSGPEVPADNATIVLVPEWTENSFTLSFTANPPDDPNDLAGTYPPDDVVIADPSTIGPVSFEADASKVVLPQVECTGYKFAGWRFTDATDKNARYDTAKTFKENLTAAGYDTTGGGDAAAPEVPASGTILKLQAVWTKIPIVVTVPTTLTAQIGFDTNNPDVRTVTVNPDLDPNDGVPAAALAITSKTEAPLQVTGVKVGAGKDLATLFPQGLYKDADAVTMSLNGAPIFNGKVLAEGGTDTLLPQETVLPSTNAFRLAACSGSGSPSTLTCKYDLAAPMAIPMAQITDPLEAASFLSIAYTFAIVPEASSTGGE